MQRSRGCGLAYNRKCQDSIQGKGMRFVPFEKKSSELELVASYGLSNEYLQKGPLHFMQSIEEALDAVPIAIYDVQDDPRIQYPDEASKEGISSLLGVPIVAHGKIIGALRLYTAEPWEFNHADIAIVQAIAQICGMSMDMCRMHKGYKTSIEILKHLRDKT
jgi:signal transduction protein with GAF and PtsI domain